MEKKVITVQTNTVKKGKLDQRVLACQVYEDGAARLYILDETKNDLVRRHFSISPGCRIIDDGVTYYIEEVQYSPRPSRPILIINPKIVL